MPIALFVIGAVFFAAAVRGPDQVNLLFSTLKDDFSGPNNFIVWALAIWAITAIGYSKTLRPLSHVFLALVILVLFLRNKGFFQQFMSQIAP